MSTTITATLTIVETMPAYLRESHRAAGNWGRYPANGARHIAMLAEDAQYCDGDEYDHVVGEVTATIEGTTVTITDAESHLLGTGTWDGSIQDCPVDLGDEIYEALEEALILEGALASVEGDDEDEDEPDFDEVLEGLDAGVYNARNLLVRDDGSLGWCDADGNQDGEVSRFSAEDLCVDEEDQDEDEDEDEDSNREAIEALEARLDGLRNDARYHELRRTYGEYSEEVLRHLEACDEAQSTGQNHT